MNDKRTVIVHIHIFKNAGSTFDWILKKNFGKDFIDHRDDKSMINGGKNYLERFLIEHPNVKAISSHHINFNPLDMEIKDTVILPVCFIRHPIARILSVYEFEKKQKDSPTPGAQKAKKMNFKEYVQWRMKPWVGATIRNVQVIYCSGMAHLGLEMADALRKAKENITNSYLTGIVDRFDQSMVLMEKHLHAYFPSIDMAYIIQNQNRKIKKNTIEIVSEIQNMLGPSLFETVLNLNRSDLSLYDAANEILDKRLEDIDDFQTKLEEFKTRCKNLRGGGLRRMIFAFP